MAWQSYTIHGVEKRLDTTEWLSTHGHLPTRSWLQGKCVYSITQDHHWHFLSISLGHTAPFDTGNLPKLSNSSVLVELKQRRLNLPPPSSAHRRPVIGGSLIYWNVLIRLYIPWGMSFCSFMCIYFPQSGTWCCTPTRVWLLLIDWLTEAFD